MKLKETIFFPSDRCWGGEVDRNKDTCLKEGRLNVASLSVGITHSPLIVGTTVACNETVISWGKKYC